MGRRFNTIEIFLIIMGKISAPRENQKTLAQTNEETTFRALSSAYGKIHDIMRNVDGLQPQEAFDEFLKILFLKQLLDSDESRTSVIKMNDSELNEVRSCLNQKLSYFLEEFDSWFLDLWQDKKFHLSSEALMFSWKVLEVFDFKVIPFDLRGLALREFIDERARKSLGIYLTPDDVVRMMVETVSPSQTDLIYDPACGSGTFLIENLKRMVKNSLATQFEIWGTDKNPRMLLLSELNLGHIQNISFKRQLIDALFPISNESDTFPKYGMFDHIFTNPPFGVILDNLAFDLRKFKTCVNRDSYVISKQSSEVVFIEQCFNYLKPGGTLSIVLPKSIISNSTFDYVREVLGDFGYIYALVSLPPETFAVTGTQTNTIVLFARKYKDEVEKSELVKIAYSKISNVGYDSTGRTRKGNQLENLSLSIKKSLEYGEETQNCKLLTEVPKGDTFLRIEELIRMENKEGESIHLSGLIDFISTGKTPARSDYTESGLFLVKVGNLTGRGIDWVPRDRNFVREERKRDGTSRFVRIEKGDILMTSSAHSPVYIGKKVDIVYEIPDEFNKEAGYVGEVMLVRPKTVKIDPYLLLAFLRSPLGQSQIQGLVKGQTAHVYAGDLMNVAVPIKILLPNNELKEIAELLKQEAKKAFELNLIALNENRRFKQLTL